MSITPKIPEKIIRIATMYTERLDEVVQAYAEKRHDTSDKFISYIKSKVVYLIAKEIDTTYLQLKMTPSYCHQKDLKKAISLLDTIFESDEFKKIRDKVFLVDIEKEEKNYEEQQFLSHYCIIAQNKKTLEYARLIYKEADDEFEAGYCLEFTKERTELTEISKVTESDLSLSYILKALDIDFPEIEWAVSRCPRLKGRNVTPYPAY